MNLIRFLITCTYYLILLFLSLYGLHRLYILYLYFKFYKWKTHTAPPPLHNDEYPTVTVQLPIYNEYYVAERIINAAAQLTYPRHLLRIQILDDSTDETVRVSLNAAQKLKLQGFNIQHIRRKNRIHFKAGALKAGLEKTDDEFIAIFDADFIPPADFLQKTIPYFKNPRIGLVQARWGYLNQPYSLLTRIQALFLDGHFMLEHTARHFSGKFFNFNGTAGVWRRKTIIESGNWQGDTLTEDLDLSYRAQMKGWEFIFLPRLVVVSELPVDIYAFKNQQHRWAKGSIQVAKKILPALWKSKVSLPIKLEATFHLASNINYVLMIILSLLMPLSIFLRYQYSSGLPQHSLLELLIFFLTMLSIAFFYAVSQRELYPNWIQRMLLIPFLFSMSIGMSITNARGVIEAFISHTSPFNRTAKYNIETFNDSWKRKIYRTIQMKFIVPEILLSLYVCIFLLLIVVNYTWQSFPFMFLFCFGYLHILLLSLLHAKN